MQTVKLSITPRSGIVAPPGYAVISTDFRNQEILIAGWVSQEPNILQVFAAPETLPLLDEHGNPVLKDGIPVHYVNPKADLHTTTAATCCFPHLFEGKEDHEWDTIARDESLIAQKGDARYYGKITGFGIIYGQGAETMSELNYVPKETCEEWIKRHKQNFPVFHAWKEEIGRIASARGWVPTTYGHIRWVAEDSAKAEGASPERSGVNHMIQGLAAAQAKLSLMKIFNLFLGTPCKLCLMVHDETVCVVPGSFKSEPSKYIYKNEICKPVFEPDDELKHWEREIQRCMEEAQWDTFEGGHRGFAKPSSSVFWAH